MRHLGLRNTALQHHRLHVGANDGRDLHVAMMQGTAVRPHVSSQRREPVSLKVPARPVLLYLLCQIPLEMAACLGLQKCDDVDAHVVEVVVAQGGLVRVIVEQLAV